MIINQLETNEGNASAEMLEKFYRTLRGLSPTFFDGVFIKPQGSGVKVLVSILKSKIKPGRLDETEPLPEQDYRDLANHLIREGVDKVNKNLDHFKESSDLSQREFQVDYLSSE